MELTLQEASLAWGQGKGVEADHRKDEDWRRIVKAGEKTNLDVYSPGVFCAEGYRFRLAQEPPAVGTAEWANSLPEGTKLTLRIGYGGWAHDKFTQKRNGVWSKWHTVAFTPDDGPKTGWELYAEPPAKRYRPWTPKEVPVGAIFRRTHMIGWFAILGSGDGGVWFATPSFGIEQTDFDDLLKHYEHYIDGGKTWLPCGVEVDA